MLHITAESSKLWEDKPFEFEEYDEHEVLYTFTWCLGGAHTEYKQGRVIFESPTHTTEVLALLIVTCKTL